MDSFKGDHDTLVKVYALDSWYMPSYGEGFRGRMAFLVKSAYSEWEGSGLQLKSNIESYEIHDLSQSLEYGLRVSSRAIQG